MTKYNRPSETIFAQDALVGEVTPFPDIARGFGIDFDLHNGFPEMEAFNGLIKLMFENMGYILQNGFSEWRDFEDYPQGAGVRVGLLWYKAKVANKGKQPSLSQNEWLPVLDLSSLTATDPITLEGGKIGIKDAAHNQKGAIRIATNAEVTSAANVIAAVTPKQSKDIAEISGLGSGQKWFTYSRPDRESGSNHVYTNNTGKPIMVKISATGLLTLYVDGVAIDSSGNNRTSGTGLINGSVSAIIPINSTYNLGAHTEFLDASRKWAELRSSR